MIEQINIWGKPGCELPNGKLCNACCVLPNIELEGTYVSVGKLANSPCPYLNDTGEGCSLQISGKPEACKTWHCSMTGADGKINLIAQGLSLGLVSEHKAVSLAIGLVKKYLPNVKELSSYIKNEVLGRSIIFSEITHAKGLVVRDLDEP
jgi:hypothetical protein